MKRSEVNALMRDSLRFIAEQGFHLPPYVTWSPTDWRQKGRECDEIRDTMLGWDITDFGSGDFARVGLILITLRNGTTKDTRYGKPYAEKIMIVRESQVTPMHFHWQKMEDIINRAGGTLMIQVYNSTPDEKLAETPVTVAMDGSRRTVPAGSILPVRPGESITMERKVYHSFWGKERTGTVLVGEVSQVNDDRSDNRFFERAGRFPTIIEDEQPCHLLCTEYP